MIGWHHCLNGHKFEQTLGDSEEQCSPVCCSPWGHKESDTSYRLTEQQQILLLSNLLNCYFLFKHYYYSSDTNIYWHKFLFQNSSHGGSEKSGKLEVGGASRDSTGFGALEEGLISS